VGLGGRWRIGRDDTFLTEWSWFRIPL